MMESMENVDENQPIKKPYIHCYHDCCAGIVKTVYRKLELEKDANAYLFKYSRVMDRLHFYTEICHKTLHDIVNNHDRRI